MKYLTPHELSQFCAEENAGMRTGTVAVQDYIDAAHPVSLKAIYTRCLTLTLLLTLTITPTLHQVRPGPGHWGRPEERVSIRDVQDEPRFATY